MPSSAIYRAAPLSKSERALEILRELDSRPAAPFYEEGPAHYIFDTAKRLGVDVRRDAYGNVIAKYRKNPDESQPPIAFVAHMDHPGFEIIEVSDERIVARALGGVPAAMDARKHGNVRLVIVVRVEVGVKNIVWYNSISAVARHLSPSYFNEVNSV